jgi:ADP-heptose:LPS heptosyltransferase
MVELVRSAHIVVGGDTGPVQIAGGLDIPVVGLFGPTAPERSRPWGRHVIMPLQAEPEEIWQAIAHLS